MLEFAQDPPTSPEDVSFSESGTFLLIDAYKFRGDQFEIEILGRAACTELVDKLGFTPDTVEFGDYSKQVRDEALKLLRIGGPGLDADDPSPEALAFMNGINYVENAFWPTRSEHEAVA